MDPDESNADYGGDDDYEQSIRREIADLVDERAPDLEPEHRARLIDSQTEKAEVGWVDASDEDGPGAVLGLTEASKAVVRREVLRVARYRDPAPKELPRVRYSTACRPLRAARRVRRHTARTTRAGPDSDSDPEPSPERMAP